MKVMELGLKQGLKQGIEQGMRQGMKKGIEENTKKIVTNMLQKGMSVEQIEELVEITREEILEIKKYSPKP